MSSESRGTGLATTPATSGPEVDGAEEDVLMQQLKADGEVYRTFRLVYLAECYAHLAISPVGDAESEEDRSQNLAKAVALIEYADTLMSNTG